MLRAHITLSAPHAHTTHTHTLYQLSMTRMKSHCASRRRASAPSARQTAAESARTPTHESFTDSNQKTTSNTWPVFASHMIAVVSNDPLNSNPKRVQPKLAIDARHRHLNKNCPVLFHFNANIGPCVYTACQRAHAKQQIMFTLCPRNSACLVPSASQMRAAPSYDAVASNEPSCARQITRYCSSGKRT
jgi:hypothetical protein